MSARMLTAPPRTPVRLSHCVGPDGADLCARDERGLARRWRPQPAGATKRRRRRVNEQKKNYNMKKQYEEESKYDDDE
eukprot:716421-Hanusia_phi.AAC.1